MVPQNQKKSMERKTLARLQTAILRYQLDQHTPALPTLTRLWETGYLSSGDPARFCGAYAVLCQARASL